MIVSHRNRFVFLKTRKTAGTSIELALSRHCGPDDIITPVSPEDEVIRSAVGGVGPQNYLAADGTQLAHNHMFGGGVRDLVGPVVWQSYFKFAVDRDPWDTVVSAYNHYRAQTTDDPVSLSEFVRESGPKLARNSGIYRFGSRVAVDRVCRFEMLDEEIAAVCERIGLPTLDLPRAKAGFPQVCSREDLAGDDVEQIRRLFARTIRLLGYAWS